MHIILSVGHQEVLAALPANLVDPDNFTLRNSLANLSQRLEALVKKRSAQFDFTIMGVKLQNVPADPSSCIVAATINAIVDVVDYAQVLGHDCVRFAMVHDLEAYVRNTFNNVEGMCKEVVSLGVHRVLLKERARLNDLLTDITRYGVEKPEVFW